MHKFLTTPAFGVFRVWHLLTAVTGLYALGGTIALAGLVAWSIQNHRQGPVLSPRAFLAQHPESGVRVRGLYWLSSSSPDKADYSLSLTSLSEEHRLATVKVEKNSKLGQEVYERLKDGLARDMTFRLGYVGKDIRIISDE